MIGFLRDTARNAADMIKSPAHYVAGRKYEPWDVIADWKLDYFTGNALKYIARAGRKPGNDEAQDLLKAMRYLEKRIEMLTEEEG